MLMQTLKFLALGTVFLGVTLEANAGQSLAGATASVVEKNDGIESFAHCSLFCSTICLGADDENIHFSPHLESLAFSPSAGLLIEEPDPMDMMASIVFDDDFLFQGEPKELVAERQSIKGCRGRALHPHETN